MHTRLLRIGVAAGIALSAGLTLTACGESSPAKDESSTTQSSSSADANSSATQGAEPEVEADLVEAKKVIDDAIADKGEQPSFYLASDVKSPEQKYGMWVLPYHHSDATEKVTEVVNIEGGKYEIVAVSAETGAEYVIDQNGNISQK